MGRSTTQIIMVASIVLVDSDLGIGVVWGTERAQVCQVLLKLGQGRAVGKGLLDLA